MKNKEKKDFARFLGIVGFGAALARFSDNDFVVFGIAIGFGFLYGLTTPGISKKNKFIVGGIGSLVLIFTLIFWLLL